MGPCAGSIAHDCAVCICQQGALLCMQKHTAMQGAECNLPPACCCDGSTGPCSPAAGSKHPLLSCAAGPQAEVLLDSEYGMGGGLQQQQQQHTSRGSGSYCSQQPSCSDLGRDGDEDACSVEPSWTDHGQPKSSGSPAWHAPQHEQHAVQQHRRSIAGQPAQHGAAGGNCLTDSFKFGGAG